MALKNKDIAKLSTEDINARLAEMQKEFMKLRAQRMTGAGQKNNRQMRTVRKTRARLLTRLNTARRAAAPARTAKPAARKPAQKEAQQGA